MKIKIGLLSMALFAAVISVNAQGGGGGMMRRSPEENTKRVVDTLNSVFKLDQDKQTQVQSVFMDFYTAGNKMREAAQGGAPFDRSKYEEMTTARDEKLKKILTEDQFKKFKDDIEPAMRPRRGGGGNGGGNGGGARAGA